MDEKYQRDTEAGIQDRRWAQEVERRPLISKAQQEGDR